MKVMLYFGNYYFLPLLEIKIAVLYSKFFSMKVLCHLKTLIVNFKILYEKCALSDQKDINFRCKNIASEFDFVLVYRNIVPPPLPFFCGIRKDKNYI